MHLFEPPHPRLSLLLFLLFLSTTAITPSASRTPPAFSFIVQGVDAENGSESFLDFLQSREWCTHIRLDCLSGLCTQGEAQAAVNRGWLPLLRLHTSPGTRARQEQDSGRTFPNTTTTLQAIAEVMGSIPVQFQFMEEEDSSGVGFPHDLLAAAPRTHADAQALLEADLALAFSSSMVPGVSARRFGIMGFASTAHAYARTGLDVMIIERANDDTGGLQVGIAFVRGAGAQYNITWGVDYSSWWGPIYGLMDPLEASFHRRHLFMAYFSGSSFADIESIGWNSAAEQPCGSNLCAEYDAFGNFTLAFPDVGTPDAPIAVLLPSDAGWLERPSWSSVSFAHNYARIPPRLGQRALDGIFSHAFPGSGRFQFYAFPFGAYANNTPPASPFALSSVTPKYAPDPSDVFYADPVLPFGPFNNRLDAQSWMQAAHDPSEFRPMSDSRWGNIMDVLSLVQDGGAGSKEETIADDLNVIDKYPVLLLADRINITAALRTRLTAYVEQGGQLVLAAGVATPADIMLTGLNLTGTLKAGRAWMWANDSEIQTEAILVAKASLAAQGAAGFPPVQVLARTLPASDPLVTVASVGRGKVWTCLVPWFEGEGSAIARVAARLLDTVAATVQPVRVVGLPAEWTSTTSSSGRRHVAISNHAEEDWVGSVYVRLGSTSSQSIAYVLDMRSGVKLPWVFEAATSEVRIDLTVGAYDVMAIRVEVSE